MQNMQRIADLKAVAEELARTGKSRKVLKHVRAVGRIQSCLADLRQANDSLEALIEMEEGFGANGTTLRNALLIHATSLYVRATHTHGQGQTERGPSPITKALVDDDRKSAHAKLVAIRNYALAHVNPGVAINEVVWNEGAVVMIESETSGHWRPSAYTNTVALDRDIVAALALLVPLGIATLRAALNEESVRMVEALGASCSGAELEDLLSSHPFDMTGFMGSEPMARHALPTAKRHSETRGTTIYPG